MQLIARDTQGGFMGDDSEMKLAAVLLALVVLGLLLTTALMFMRNRRRRAELRSSLPQYEQVRPSSARSQHRRLNTRPESSFVLQEKQMLMESSDSLPLESPVPEIRITLPEEMDQAGTPRSGRVVVVHVGNSTVGFEPLDEQLPPYQSESADRFQSLDLDRIGGLKEKEYK